MSINNFGVRLKRYPTAEQEFPWKSWREIRWDLTTDEIKLVAELSEKFQNNQFVKLPEIVLKVVLKYIVHSYAYDECERIFEAFENNYNESHLASALEALITSDIIESNKEKRLWVILKEQEDKWNNNRKEQERISNDVISKSYKKYYEEYKTQFGFTYQSPNVDSKSNYGFFLNTIIDNLKDNGVNFNLKQPWSKSYQDYSNEIYINKFGESDVQTIYTPKVSKLIKDLLNTELKDKYYELQIKYELKRFFLLGGITPEILLLDYVKCYGYEFLKKHLSELKWEEFNRDLECYLNGTYGIQNGWNYKYFAKHKEQDVYLIGLVRENPEFHQNTEILKDNKLMDFYKKFGHDFEVERIKEIYHSPILTTIIDDFQVHEFIRDKEMYYEYIKSFAGPENEIRKLLGFKEIGEGWVSETKLFYLIKERFKEHRVIQHGKPKWLGKQHLDIFIPDLNIGIEYQGKQHTMPLGIFGGEDSFQENVKRDKRKKKLCENNNCKLFEVFPEDDFFLFIDTLQDYIEK